MAYPKSYDKGEKDQCNFDLQLSNGMCTVSNATELSHLILRQKTMLVTIRTITAKPPGTTYIWRSQRQSDNSLCYMLEIDKIPTMKHLTCDELHDWLVSNTNLFIIQPVKKNMFFDEGIFEVKTRDVTCDKISLGFLVDALRNLKHKLVHFVSITAKIPGYTYIWRPLYNSDGSMILTFTLEISNIPTMKYDNLDAMCSWLLCNSWLFS